MQIHKITIYATESQKKNFDDYHITQEFCYVKYEENAYDELLKIEKECQEIWKNQGLGEVRVIPVMDQTQSSETTV